jgi:hypothetical protein
MLVLALTLTAIAVIAFLIVTSITKHNTKVLIEPSSTRTFKNEVRTVNLILIFKRARWINVNLSSVKGPFGLETSFTSQKGKAKISLVSKYSGSFSGLTLQFEIVDVLNLFSKQIQTIQSDFTFECLPLSILTPIPRSRPMPLTLGDRSGRSPGSGLELYALDEYQPFTETKNIMWKRVARMPNEKLVVRIRDSSIPKLITIGFIQSKLRHEEAKLEWMDLTCEAIGTMGNGLLAAGCMVEILYTSAQSLDPIQKHEVSNVDELSEAIVHLWDPPMFSEDRTEIFHILSKSDIVVCGMRELEDEGLSHAISKKPTLAVFEERVTPRFVGQQSMIFTGVEDVRKLVSRILEA